MKGIQLVELDPEIQASLTRDPGYLDAMAEENWAQVAAVMRRLVGPTLPATPTPGIGDPPPWGGYLAVDTDTRRLIGSCAFKGPPTEDRSVEIAYLTYPDFEGRGYATLMAQELIGLASRGTAIGRIIAHTLPEASASTRVLEKAGMRCVGEVLDPDDGRVWRWQTDVSA